MFCVYFSCRGHKSKPKMCNWVLDPLAFGDSVICQVVYNNPLNLQCSVFRVMFRRHLVKLTLIYSMRANELFNEFFIWNYCMTDFFCFVPVPVTTPKDCSPTLSPHNSNPFSRSIDNSVLSRYVSFHYGFFALFHTIYSILFNNIQLKANLILIS